MRVTFLLIFILIALCSCSQNKLMNKNEFQKDVNKFMAAHYTFTGEKEYNILNPDSLRSTLFFSNALKSGKQNSYSKSVKGENQDAVLFLTFYLYKNADSAISIVERIRKDKENRLQQGFYGPLGKDFQFFFSASNFVVHLEAKCQTANEKDWLSLSDTLLSITKNHFSTFSSKVIKPCE